MSMPICSLFLIINCLSSKNNQFDNSFNNGNIIPPPKLHTRLSYMWRKIINHFLNNFPFLNNHSLAFLLYWVESHFNLSFIYNVLGNIVLIIVLDFQEVPYHKMLKRVIDNSYGFVFLLIFISHNSIVIVAASGWNSLTTSKRINVHP